MCNQSLAESFFLDQCFLLFASTNRHHAMRSDTESLGGEECDVLPKTGENVYMQGLLSNT